MPRDDTYTVYRDGVDLGMVWREGSVWHADYFSLHAPRISAETREAAAARLPDDPFEARPAGALALSTGAVAHRLRLCR